MRGYLSFNARRALAMLLDGGVLAAAMFQFTSRPIWIAAVLVVSYRLLFHLTVGATPGKAAVGLRVDSSRKSIPRSLIRDAMAGAAVFTVEPDFSSPWNLVVTAVVGVDILIGLIRTDHRTLHDYLGGTHVARQSVQMRVIEGRR